ncbi:MAG: DUF4097 family beta strand repeat-containing protein [Prevotella sp.]|nr:DUF4097 family beta strand repeat-containing protein [Prevotella sp.]
MLLLLVLAGLVAGCSTQKNTAKSRWWHSFNARYNTYYNGTLAYIDGSLEKENGHKDNFTEIIPLYTVGSKQSKEIGKGNFDKAIEKCQKAIKLHSIKHKPEWTKKRRKTERDIEWLSRKEYNPFLWKAWMLMGRSQFYKGAFDEAASTFNYMSRLYQTQPAIYGRARAWLAKCYIEQEWIYDAEDVIRNMRRDSIHWRAQKEWDYTMADYYIHTGDYEEAIPYLRKTIKHEMRKRQKAREYYLLGQLEAELGHKQEAYKAYKKVVAQNPPYEVEFNARIAMTEVMAAGQAKKMISRLKRMAASDKNKDYLDQVYYAIGNIYLAQRDTAHAIGAYEKGNEKATRSGIEKGVLLLKLGDLYWQKEKFNDAQRCYGEAIGLLDKERPDYEQLSRRSKVLDELVPYTDAVHLQDSLQALAKMSEKDRNAAIDRVIEALKKKEKEEQRKQAEANAQQQTQRNGGMGNRGNTPNTAANNQQQQGKWYFYNPMAVQQGKQTFEKQWGKRENVDNWQRINQTVVAGMGGEEGEMPQEMLDSIAQAQAAADSLEQVTDSAQNDPHKREYYLAQIPFTEDQVAASNLVIQDGLYNSGVIFKDKLDNLPLSEKQFYRLLADFPEFEQLADVYYHMFLLHSRKGEFDIAQTYVDKLAAEYPESQWTTLLTDPYFKENARFGEQMEDSLYGATYDAFKADRYSEVRANAHISEERFPLGENRDKFIFIGGLSKLNDGDGDGCLADMKLLVEKFPQSKLAEMAGMIVNGVKEGRRLHGGKFDLGDVWSRRSVVLSDSDSISAREFSPERNEKFYFIIAYHPDSVNQNKLLFELARYNFTSFMVRNFNLEIVETDGPVHMQVSGFLNYDEARQYARQLYQQENIMRLLGSGGLHEPGDTISGSRAIIISETNLPLLGKQFSYDDYEVFYEENFVPLEIDKRPLLSEPAEIGYDEDDSKYSLGGSDDEENGEGIDEEGTAPAGGEFFGDDEGDTPVANPEDNIIVNEEDDLATPRDDEETIVPTDEPTTPVNTDDGGITIPTEETTTTPVETEDGGITIPTEETTTTPIETDDGGITIPTEETTTTPVETDDGGITIPTEETTATPVETDDGGITIPSEETTTTPVDTDEGGITIPTEETKTTPVETDDGGITIADEETTQPENSGDELIILDEPTTTTEDEDIIILDEDETGTTTSDDSEGVILDEGNSQEKEDGAELEDEYFELDGF